MVMTCRDVRELTSPFLHGSLHSEQRLDFHRHLAVCPTCAAAVEKARDAFELSRAACAKACDPIPDEVPNRLVRAIWATSHAGR